VNRPSVGLAILAVLAGPLHGQTLRVAVGATGVSFSEVGEALQYDGAGGNAMIDVRFGKFMVQGEGFIARLVPDAETGLTEDIDVRQADLRIAYFLNPALAIQIGASGREATPANTTTNVGYGRIGLISENRLGSIARIWVRGAYLPNPRFSAGGSAEFAFEIGLGTWIGTSNGRFGARIEYDFQRIDRQVNDIDAPQQLMVGRLSFEVGF
jgi:hypothetical protein